MGKKKKKTKGPDAASKLPMGIYMISFSPHHIKAHTDKPWYELVVSVFSHSTHTVQTEASEAGEDQGLSANGGGVHSEPRADEAT